MQFLSDSMILSFYQTKVEQLTQFIFPGVCNETI